LGVERALAGCLTSSTGALAGLKKAVPGGTAPNVATRFFFCFFGDFGGVEEEELLLSFLFFSLRMAVSLKGAEAFSLKATFLL
jgi:hypothetical protein